MGISKLSGGQQLSASRKMTARAIGGRRILSLAATTSETWLTRLRSSPTLSQLGSPRIRDARLLSYHLPSERRFRTGGRIRGDLGDRELPFSIASAASVWLTPSRQLAAEASVAPGDPPRQFYRLDPATNVVTCSCKLELPETVPRLSDFVLRRNDVDDEAAMIVASSGNRITYRDLKLKIKQFGQRLIELELLQFKGDMLSIVCQNSIQFAIAFFGIISVGGVPALHDGSSVADELEHEFRLTAPRCVLSSRKELESVLSAIHGLGQANTITTVIVSDVSSKDEISKLQGPRPKGCALMTWSDVMTPEGEAESEPSMLVGMDHFSQEDIAILPFSSGTSGLSKGVSLSHRNMVANIVQISNPFLNKVYEKERLVGLLPFSHVYGTASILCHGLYSGSTVIVMENFDPAAMLDLLAKYKPTVFPLVTPVLMFLATFPMIKKEHLESLKSVVLAAAPAPLQMIHILLKKLDKSATFQEGYGMTETSPGTHWLPYSAQKKIGSCGGPVPGTEAAIRDMRTGKFLGPKKMGEIVVRGPQVMLGYYKDPAKTAETLSEDGWLSTGDVGYYDEDGFFYVVDRVKELIKVKGLQVPPAELEAILQKHRKVAVAAVIGIPDERLGEAPRAYVVARLGPDRRPLPLDPEELVKFVQPRVAHHKWLAGGVEVVKVLPRNARGKVLRRELKARYMERLGRVQPGGETIADD